MLCLSCQRQSICLVRQMSQSTPRLSQLLEKLQNCEMRVSSDKPVAHPVHQT